MNTTDLPSELLHINATTLFNTSTVDDTQGFITKKEKKQIKKEKKAAEKHPVTLVIYAIPLFRDREVMLMAPPPPFRAPGRLRHKVAENWKEYDPAEAGKGSNKAKFYDWGVRKMEAISPSTRLLANVPKNVGGITVVHGSSEFHDTLYRDLSSVAKTSRFKYTAKSIMWSLALPFLAFVDALALGWPKVGSTVDVVFVCKNANAAKGAKRLRKALSKPESRLVGFSESDCLDAWRDRVRQREEGVLTDQEIVQLCYELQKPDLAMPMMEIRRTYLRSIGRYDLLTPELAIGAPPLPPPIPVFVAL